MPVKQCLVSFRDSRNIIHTVEVSAETLFEAAVLGLNLLKQDGFIEDPIGGSTRLEVEVRHPGTKHTVSLIQLQRWLQGACVSPADRVKKERLKGLFFK